MPDRLSAPTRSLGDCFVEAVIPPKNTAAAKDKPKSLPVGGLGPLPHDKSLFSQIASIDGRGRVSDRSTLRQLDWPPGTRISIEAAKDKIVIVSIHGLYEVSKQGYVILPAVVRHWCGIDANDRVFLCASAEHEILVIHHMAALNEMVLNYHQALAGGDAL